MEIETEIEIDGLNLRLITYECGKRDEAIGAVVGSSAGEQTVLVQRDEDVVGLWSGRRITAWNRRRSRSTTKVCMYRVSTWANIRKRITNI